MPKHNFLPARGTTTTITIDSRALAGNLLGDPSSRAVAVYVPRECEPAGSYPLFVFLAGFTGSGLRHLSWQAFGESIPQRIDRLIREGKIGPVVAAFPDGFTSLGGNQYIDSIAMGRWEEFLISEMIPRVEREFPVRADRVARAVLGKSSGGYGALAHGLLHAETWGAVACHSGDIGFDWVYRADFPKTLGVLARFGGDIEAFLRALEEKPKIADDEMHALMALAMAATYDPDASAPKGIRLPVDPRTCALDETRWAAWLAHDPLHMVERPACRENLRRLHGLFIDCGSRDQYFVQYGARSFTQKLSALGIAHRYEEFDDNHSSIDYRMDVSLPFLYAALTDSRRLT